MGLLGDLWNLINEEADVASEPNVIINQDTLSFSDCDLEIPLLHICDIQTSEQDDESEQIIFTHITGLKFSVPIECVRMDSEKPDIGISAARFLHEACNNTDLSIAARISYIETVLESFTSAYEIFVYYNSENYRYLGSFRIFGIEALFRSVGLFILDYLIFRNSSCLDNSEDFAEFNDWEKENQSRIEELDDILELYREKIGLGEDSVEAYVLSKLRLNEYINKIFNPKATLDDFYCIENYTLSLNADPSCELWSWEKWLDQYFNDPKTRASIYCTDRLQSYDHVGETANGMTIVRLATVEKLIAFQSSDDPLDTPQGWRKSHPDMPIAQAMAKAKEYRAARDARRLVFEMGHPRNNTLYIQDPLQTNVYIDAESFHAGMLERKYNELIRVLTALGATRISCIVENSESKEERRHNKYSVDGSSSYKVVKGSGHFSSDTSSSKITNLYKRLSVERILTPPKTIELPNDLVFYPFEQRWQDIAKLAKEGRLKKEVVDLTYRTDYAVTGKYLRDIGGKIETLIVGAEVAYSDEFEHELKELQSIVWHYEVEFGDMESVTPTEISEQVSLPAPTNVANSESDRAKQILSKRIKRYAQSNNGLINQEQRADLESFAQKYGIDELELEEMIEEAF